MIDSEQLPLKAPCRRNCLLDDEPYLPRLLLSILWMISKNGGGVCPNNHRRGTILQNAKADRREAVSDAARESSE